MFIYLNNGVWTIVLFQRGMVMAEKKIRIKAVYILLWSIIVCAGVFIRTGVMDDLWKHMYDLVYGDSANAVRVGTYGGVNRENNIYCYMDFWQVDQQYLPDNIAGRVFYEPSDNGYEKNIQDYFRKIKNID